MKKNMICISCPMGCHLQVHIGKDREILSVQGNSCPRGVVYAKSEIKNPRRILCSTMKVEQGEFPLVSVKTKDPIPKDKIFDVMKVINTTRIKAPVTLGDVLIQDVCHTGIDIVATTNVSHE
ncbi:MAG: DUF1667 domain-containing protein [Tissierellia bacterium]|nr:DUF1667 domain-containing protein [Tissierellia bacterium]